jgi:hypothetical protein
MIPSTDPHVRYDMISSDSSPEVELSGICGSRGRFERDIFPGSNLGNGVAPKDIAGDSVAVNTSENEIHGGQTRTSKRSMQSMGDINPRFWTASLSIGRQVHGWNCRGKNKQLDCLA